MIRQEMTLKMVSENVAVLQRNGEDMVCPFVPPMQIRQRFQNALGQVSEQISIQKSPCNSNCPLFTILKGNVIALSCSTNAVNYMIEKCIPLPEINNQKQDKDDNNSNVISIIK